MGRIQKFYETSLATLLGPGSVTAAIAEAQALASARGISSSFALALTHAGHRQRLGITSRFPQTLFCDAGLGGLARWLRGTGYEAHWNPDLDDAAAIRETQRLGATLITTDSLMMERGVLRDGIVRAVFVPSSITCEEQLVVVVRELALPMRESRCMNCGGVLRRVEKQTVAERIPPKTAKWLDEYFVCVRCDQLFWRGTHWRKITARLAELNRSFAPSA
jgi:uncharacterized protein